MKKDLLVRSGDRLKQSVSHSVHNDNGLENFYTNYATIAEKTGLMDGMFLDNTFSFDRVK